MMRDALITPRVEDPQVRAALVAWFSAHARAWYEQACWARTDTEQRLCRVRAAQAETYAREMEQAAIPERVER